MSAEAGTVVPALRRLGEPRRPWSWRLDGAILVGLVSFTVLSRLPSRSRYLHEIDSVNFALAMERYDVTAMRPHPPGYPVFVAVGKFVHLLIREENAALVATALLFSAAAVGLLYGFAREWASVRAAAAAAALFAVAPVNYYHGLVALSYTSEAAASVGIAWLAWRTYMRPSRRNVIILAAATGLVIGLRQSLLFFLLPLVVFAILPRPWRTRDAARRVAAAAGAGAATVSLWMVPMVALSTEGLAGYGRATGFVGRYVIFHDTVFTGGLDALRDHFDRLDLFLQPERAVVGGVAFVLFLTLVASKAGFGRPWTEWPDGAGAFFAAWVVPSLAFYLLIFDGLDTVPSGYVLVFLPAGYLLATTLGDAALRRIESAPRWRSARTMSLALAMPLLLAPAPFLVVGWEPLVATEILPHDEWADGWSALPGGFPADSTGLLTWFSWPHAKWYFPDYVIWNYTPFPLPEQPGWILTRETRQHEDDVSLYDGYLRGPGGPAHAIPEGVARIVLWDFQLAGENGAARRIVDDVAIHEDVLANGWRVLYLDVDPERTTIESYFKAPETVPGFA